MHRLVSNNVSCICVGVNDNKFVFSGGYVFNNISYIASDIAMF